MARTRAQIKTAVGNNTGRGTEKATLIETLCDEALQVAGRAHPFRDSRSTYSIALTEDVGYASMTSTFDFEDVGPLMHIVTARIVETDGAKNRSLPMKDEIWWAKNVINPEDNSKGWPAVGIRRGNRIIFDRPLESGLTLILIASTEHTFLGDAHACPIAILDTFIVQYVTAFVFLSVQANEQFAYWKHLALGWKWDEGTVGGSLKHAIDTDSKDIAEEPAMEPPHLARRAGISVMNLIPGHDDFGNVRSWLD